MNEQTKFSRGRIEEAVRGQDATNRARQATNAAIEQSKDRLGTPGVGGQSL